MDDLQISKKRSISYWFVDGISEIGTGSVIAFMGCLFLLLAVLPHGSKWNLVIAYGQPVFIVGAFYLVSKIVRAFKDRVTFPRTGFVSYIRPKINKRIQRGVMAGSISAAVSILTMLISGKLDQRFVPLFISALLAIAFILFGFYYGVKRFYILTAIILLTGVVLFILNLPDPLDSAWLFLSAGGGMICSGLITMIHYLRTTHPAAPEELG